MVLSPEVWNWVTSLVIIGQTASVRLIVSNCWVVPQRCPLLGLVSRTGGVLMGVLALVASRASCSYVWIFVWLWTINCLPPPWITVGDVGILSMDFPLMGENSVWTEWKCIFSRDGKSIDSPPIPPLGVGLLQLLVLGWLGTKFKWHTYRVASRGRIITEGSTILGGCLLQFFLNNFKIITVFFGKRGTPW